MQVVAWVAIAAIVVLAVAALAWFAGRQRAEAERLAGSLQQLLASTAEQSRQLAQLAGQLGGMAGQLGQVAQSVQQQLEAVRTQLQQGLSETGKITQELQQAVGGQLRQLAEQLGALQENTQQVSQAAHTLQAVLTGARTRGALGEVLLEQLLQDLLPAGSYQTQVRFQDGSTVDAVVQIEEKQIPIDSKFPLEAYRRLLDNEQDEAARREFIRAVRAHADTIARKYIRPAEGTMDFALMFVPSESVYYAMLTTTDNNGSLEDYCRQKRVIPVSPNTLYAYLGVIVLGLRGIQIEKNARLILERLSGLQNQLKTLTETHDRLGRHLTNAYNTFQDSSSQLRELGSQVRQLVSASAGSTAPELPLGPDR
jgi:DNA recombination protein RmuC